MPKPRLEGRPTLEVTEIAGMGKEARQARARILANVFAQSKLLMLTTPMSEDGKTTIYAIVVGDDKGDGLFAVDLKESFNARDAFARESGRRWDLVEEVAVIKAGPDLSPDMADPCWVGRCRRCGQVVSVVPDDRSNAAATAHTMRLLGYSVATGYLVTRTPDPGEYSVVCGCQTQESPPSSVEKVTTCNDSEEGEA